MRLLEARATLVLLADNSTGFPEGQPSMDQYGLVNMRTHFAVVGGTCHVRTRTGGGTEVELRVELAAAAQPT